MGELNYPECIRELYESEIFGEALTLALLEVAKNDRERYHQATLLQLETERVPLPGDEEDSIKPLQLFCQIIHQRDQDVGVILKGGDLKIREKETIKADPFGAATVDIYDEKNIGTLSIEPLIN